ncbi:hypothetical protein VM1G_00049 [Cytospora mali]|uniref:Uncharacterized protein n=1 Tax=Cytospora mali TaxID=578113 RepID=A0A194VKW0_CYTMA|nr:hypothetical protein VM1G_00049 [Valsa mali]
MSTADELSSTPIRNKLAIWIPRVAATGCMGLTYWLGSQNDDGLKGVYALAFPFFGNDPASRLHASYLVSNLISPILIWTIEGNRAGNAMTPLALPSIVGAAVQISGIEKIAPIYYLFAIAAGDTSMASPEVTPGAAKVVLPATLLAYALPGALMALLPLTATEVSRSIFTPQSLATYAFFLAPVTVPLLTTAISKAMKWLSRREGPTRKESEVKSKKVVKGSDERTYHHSTGVPALKTAYAVTFAIQAAHHIYTLAKTSLLLSSAGQLSLTAVLGDLLTKSPVPGQRFTSVSLYAGATLGFGLYTVWDLWRRGYTTNRKASKAALGVVTGQVLFGPGATYAGLWWWREVAVISLVGSVAATAITVWFNWMTDIRKRRSEASKLVAKYHDPLLRAAQELQSRLYNMTAEEGWTIFDYALTEQQLQENVIAYTCFLIGQFCAWVHILQREGQFMQFSSDTGHRDFVNALDAIHEAFSDYKWPLFDTPFCLWRNQQLGIGEVMTIKEEGGQLLCISYAEYSKKLSSEDADMRWFKTLQYDIAELARAHQDRKDGEEAEIRDSRLRVLQHLLVKLVLLLDPLKLRSDRNRTGLVKAADGCPCDQKECTARGRSVAIDV